VLSCNARVLKIWLNEKTAAGQKVNSGLCRLNIKVERRSCDPFHQDFCSKNSAGLLPVKLLHAARETAVVRFVTPCCHCRFVGTRRVVECTSASPVPICFHCFVLR
jgi:hypothetical protein